MLNILSVNLVKARNACNQAKESLQTYWNNSSIVKKITSCVTAIFGAFSRTKSDSSLGRTGHKAVVLVSKGFVAELDEPSFTSTKFSATQSPQMNALPKQQTVNEETLPKTDAGNTNVLAPGKLERLKQAMHVGKASVGAMIQKHPHIAAAVIAAGIFGISKGLGVMLRKANEHMVSPDVLNSIGDEDLTLARSVTSGNPRLIEHQIAVRELSLLQETPDYSQPIVPAHPSLYAQHYEETMATVRENLAIHEAQQRYSASIADASKSHFNPEVNEDWAREASTAPKGTHKWTELAENDSAKQVLARQAAAFLAETSSKHFNPEANEDWARGSTTAPKGTREWTELAENDSAKQELARKAAAFLAETSSKHFNPEVNEDWAREASTAPKGTHKWTELAENDSAKQELARQAAAFLAETSSKHFNPEVNEDWARGSTTAPKGTREWTELAENDSAKQELARKAAAFLAETSSKHFNPEVNEDWAREAATAPKGTREWTELAENDSAKQVLARQAAAFLAETSKKHFNPEVNEDWSREAPLASEATPEWTELAENHISRPVKELLKLEDTASDLREFDKKIQDLQDRYDVQERLVQEFLKRQEPVTHYPAPAIKPVRTTVDVNPLIMQARLEEFLGKKV